MCHDLPHLGGGGGGIWLSKIYTDTSLISQLCKYSKREELTFGCPDHSLELNEICLIIIVAIENLLGASNSLEFF